DHPVQGGLGQALFEIVQRHPQATAVVCDGQALDYATLWQRAQALASRLRAHGVGPESPVGLCLERSPELVVGMVGIVLAGATYVPLETHYPLQRLQFLLRDSAVRLVVAHAPTRELLAQAEPALPLLMLDAPSPVPVPVAAPVPVHPGQLAYVIYTSGSTGTPKGVGVSHANVLRLLHATRADFGFGPHDVWSCFHSIAFDFSVWELWGALLHGARVVVVPHWAARSPQALWQLMREQRVSVLSQTPSAFYQLMREPGFVDEAFAHGLRWVVFGGEALDSRRLLPWWQRPEADRPAFVNMYGITETTVHVTFERIDAPEPAWRSVGRPIDDLRVFVLDAHGQPQPVGVPGELYVGGAGLARGYLRRPGLTAERFVPDPFGTRPGQRLYRSGDRGRWRPDGRIEFLGRADDQVKVRGFRIEPGEVEAALRLCEGVTDAHVDVFRPAADDEPMLVAYVVTGHLDAAALREHLLRSLPSHMVPQRWVALPALPLNQNGKLDRRALPSP
ncbi:amino acid adenylation domain-containing protein, partial [Thiomonas sp.]|uniref:amino acid adenylation domain-containing protein n=1 Tax=Thiomonas sp. TaxID=2047785 RepID=UPI002618AA19